MEGTKVYGCSDDLVEVEGDFEEEFGVFGKTHIRLSDGTLLRAEYGGNKPGIWEIIVEKQGGLFDRREECFDEDADVYSDVVYFKPGIKWARKTVTGDLAPTPGNWSVKESWESDGYCIVSGAKSEPIADAIKNEADAGRMAAALDLLEACEAMVAESCDGCLHIPDDCAQACDSKAILLAKAAIAKASGAEG